MMAKKLFVESGEEAVGMFYVAPTLFCRGHKIGHRRPWMFGKELQDLTNHSNQPTTNLLN
jgi:hypothetical protein